MNAARPLHAPERGPAGRGLPAVTLSPEQFAQLRDRLAFYSGVYLDPSRQRVLETALVRRMGAGGDLAAYMRLIAGPQGAEELQGLAEAVLNHETFFFRNKPHMRVLRDVVLPELHRRKPFGEPIRLWSAGCSTGEEPYSLAMVASEAFGQGSLRRVEVWATDLSHAALARARAGFYQGRTLGGLSPEQLARYFQPRGSGQVVQDWLRAMVRFDYLNLLEPFPPAAQGVDAIFCQNVLIYFQLDTCRAVLERFHACLPAHGALFLGFSETLWNVFSGFRSQEVAGAYVYYKEERTTAPKQSEPAPPGPAARPQTAPLQRANRPDPAVVRRPRTEAAPRAAEVGALAAPREQPAASALVQRSRELLAQGQAEQALEALRQVAPDSPLVPQALVLLARIHADRDALDMALAEIERATALDPLIDEAYALRGAIYGRQGQWAAAVRQFERARYLNPEAPLIIFHLAEAYRQLRRNEAAAREYRNTLRRLDAHPPDAVLDGVAVAWLRETCQRHLNQLLNTP